MNRNREPQGNDLTRNIVQYSSYDSPYYNLNEINTARTPKEDHQVEDLEKEESELIYEGVRVMPGMGGTSWCPGLLQRLTGARRRS